MRLAVIGDVGGQLDSFERLLSGLGVDVRAAFVPEDLVVCQVGDLVHRGPDSPGVVALVDRLLRGSGGRYVQLAGNHEAQYIFEPRFEWPERLPASSVSLLRSWWEEGLMLLAASFDTTGVPVRFPGGVRVQAGAGELLVTHAGLGVGCWRRLGEPVSAVEAAVSINALREDPRTFVWDAGRMLGRPNFSAGPVWAEALEEVLVPWSGVGVLPFSQVHGHSSPFFWGGRRGSSPSLREVSRRPGVLVHIDQERRIVRTTIGERAIWGVDPGHGVSPAPVWEPLVLDLV